MNTGLPCLGLYTLSDGRTGLKFRIDDAKRNGWHWSMWGTTTPEERPEGHKGCDNSCLCCLTLRANEMDPMRGVVPVILDEEHFVVVYRR